MGALHNTCIYESLTFYDLDRLPRSHPRGICTRPRQISLELADRKCTSVAAVSSRPRLWTCRRPRRGCTWRAAPKTGPGPPPEYGHATNAVCVVALRGRPLAGLYIYRRTFLVSYDPAQDDAQHTLLARILGAVVPGAPRRHQPRILLLLHRSARLGLRYEAAAQRDLVVGGDGWGR